MYCSFGAVYFALRHSDAKERSRIPPMQSLGDTDRRPCHSDDDLWESDRSPETSDLKAVALCATAHLNSLRQGRSEAKTEGGEFHLCIDLSLSEIDRRFERRHPTTQHTISAFDFSRKNKPGLEQHNLLLLAPLSSRFALLPIGNPESEVKNREVSILLRICLGQSRNCGSAAVS